MSETHCMAKTPQLHPKQGIPVSYLNPPLSPYLGALVVQFSLGSFYKFVSISLMVLYQFESLHLDDYNLIYSQNKNRGFDKMLTAFPLKTKHFSFYNHSSKLIPTKNTLQNSTQQNPKTHLQPEPNSFYPHLGFSPTQTQKKRGLGFESYLKSLSNFNTKVPPCF